MTVTIQMGNDEFILYIRKNYPSCSLTNDQLGKQIWRWLRDNGKAQKVREAPQDSYWGEEGDFVSALRLPSSATQFLFNPETLPQLYAHLDTLGSL